MISCLPQVVLIMKVIEKKNLKWGDINSTEVDRDGEDEENWDGPLKNEDKCCIQLSPRFEKRLSTGAL